MGDVIDLTFTDSDTEAPPARVAPAPPPRAPGGGAMSTALRRLLSLHEGGTDDAQPSQPRPPSPETIELLDSPDPTRPASPREPAEPSNPAPPPDRRPGRTAAAAAAAALRAAPLPFDDDDDGALAAAQNRGAAADREWQPAPAAAPAPAPAGPPAGRKPKRTREEISAAAAERKQREAVEKAARKAERQYNSDRHIMRYLSVVLDQRMMTSPLGLDIARAFQETQATSPEHEQIRYSVKDTPLGDAGLCAAKWVRQVPATFSSSQAPPASQMALGAASQGAGALELVDEEEPHVLVCFEGEAFVAAVLRDGLASVFAALAADCPDHRPHFLVHRLDQYLTRREREDFNRTLNRGGAGNGTADPSQAFNRRGIDDFVHRMAVEAPHVCFRDVSTAEEGSGHVVSLTKAIAQRVLAPGGAARYLSAQGRGKRGGSAALTSVLSSHPVPSASTRAAMAALCTLPSVGPQVAHAVASRYQSLGALMEMLFDPRRIDADKISELENLTRPGAGEGRRTRVGPKAARQLLSLFISDDHDILVRE